MIALEERRGFVMPAALFALAVMSVLAVAALRFANDEQRSSRALRESAYALYAAEAGGNLLMANTSSLDSVANTLGSGDSADLGWQTLSGGASYRPVLHRYDAGGQEMYLLSVEGRGSGPSNGQRVIHLMMTTVDPIPVSAALKGGAGAGDDDDDDDDGPGIVLGAPPIVIDSTLVGTDLFDWGALDFDALVAMADIVLPDDERDGDGIAPRVSGSTCDTSDPWNWGDPNDPTSPCFGYFPIIYAPGDLEIEGHADGEAVGQGILLVENELEIKDGFEFYGIIIVRGEAEFETDDDDDGDDVTGSIVIHGGVITGGETELEGGGTRVQYSRCAVNRAMGDLRMLVPIEERFWTEVLR